MSGFIIDQQSDSGAFIEGNVQTGGGGGTTVVTRDEITEFGSFFDAMLLDDIGELDVDIIDIDFTTNIVGIAFFDIPNLNARGGSMFMEIQRVGFNEFHRFIFSWTNTDGDASTTLDSDIPELSLDDMTPPGSTVPRIALSPSGANAARFIGAALLSNTNYRARIMTPNTVTGSTSIENRTVRDQNGNQQIAHITHCLLYTSPSPRDS